MKLLFALLLLQADDKRRCWRRKRAKIGRDIERGETRLESLEGEIRKRDPS